MKYQIMKPRRTSRGRTFLDYPQLCIQIHRSHNLWESDHPPRHGDLALQGTEMFKESFPVFASCDFLVTGFGGKRRGTTVLPAVSQLIVGHQTTQTIFHLFVRFYPISPFWRTHMFICKISWSMATDCFKVLSWVPCLPRIQGE